jgi:hypothetical protein
MATRAFDGSDRVADLREEIGRLTERLTRAEQTLAARRPARRLGHGRRWLAATLLAILVAAMPLALVAATPFNDLNPDSAHNGDIDLIYSAGITRGCVPNRKYCPNANVTNEQLATFLARTAGLGNYPPVANARTAVHAEIAANANTLQGHGIGDFVLADEETRLDYPFLGAVPVTIYEPPVITHGNGPVTAVAKPGISTTFMVLLPMDVPTRLFGEQWEVTSVEACYKVEGTAYISSSELRQGRMGEDSEIVSSTVDRGSTTPACYTMTPDSPVPLTSSVYLELSLSSSDSGDLIRLYSAQLRLRPLD